MLSELLLLGVEAQAAQELVTAGAADEMVSPQTPDQSVGAGPAEQPPFGPRKTRSYSPIA